MVPSYPKIFSLGSDYIENIFKGEVEITEKIDGSMFGFGLDKDGNFVMRSKGQQIFADNCQKLFAEAMNYVISIQDKIMKNFTNNTYFYGEYLQKPFHNVLHYERIPTNHIMLFGMTTGGKWITDRDELEMYAAILGLEVVPLLYKGELISGEQGLETLKKIINETTSMLGKEIIEGIVIKNYNEKIIVGNQLLPIFGKFVREQFKERLGSTWKGQTDQGKLEVFLKSFKSEARWQKAVQHLREDGKLLNEPKDIGLLLKEIQIDIISEEKENIKNELFNLFIDRIKRISCGGVPEWYKEQLLKKSFEKP